MAEELAGDLPAYGGENTAGRFDARCYTSSVFPFSFYNCFCNTSDRF